MEAVPRLHMLWFALKSSPEGASFANLKKYIAEFYQEDAESYSKEVLALETLRNQAMHPTKDGSAVMKRYYCQLHALQTRFPQLSERRLVTFHWKDLYANQVHEVHDLRYEMAAVLFNVAASHTQVGASVTRGDADGMKLACTHFQCAAWTFGELRERYASVNGGSDFMTMELLTFMQQVAFAQAQECILEKSLIDSRKPNIVAKVTAQIVNYYSAALAALLTGGDDGPVAQVIDSAVYKLWKKYVRFKIAYLNCILYLYQGQHAEEQQKMGERVTLYQAAWEKLEEARKDSRGLPDQKEINESLIFTADVVEAKRKNAKNENEFIYHEAVPELCDIPAVQGANLVNGISFSVTDAEVAGEDIFARLVPMKAHEASSIYSEKKAQLLRKYGALIEERDHELNGFMNSLTLDPLNVNEEKANKIPQGIVDRCAALNANKSAITELISAMSQLAEITADVELNLKEIGAILDAEQRQEQQFQEATGVQRTPNAHIIELTREYQKYLEAHKRAGESNDTLRKAMELHVNNLKILAHPLADIQKSVPKLSAESNTAEVFKEVKLLLNKVNEMKAQRQQFHAELRISINDDDITSKLIAQGIDAADEMALQQLFNAEFNKHERLTQLIDQNLLAQKNILAALTDAYAQAAPLIKTVIDVKQKRESFFSSLAASYDVYEDLLAKSAKGLEFYKKLSGNVQKLLTRLKSARDVQSEERQQRLKNVATSKANAPLPHANIISNSTSVGAPKLRDYLKSNTAAAVVAAAATANTAVSVAGLTEANAAANTNYVPTIRPNPLGSEAPVQTVCQASAFYAGGVAATVSTAPNEPPPPYSFMPQPAYYDTTAVMNAMLQQQPQLRAEQQHMQHMAPPAYKAQASPNSQFTALSMTQQQPKQAAQESYANHMLNYNYAALPNNSLPAAAQQMQHGQTAMNNAYAAYAGGVANSFMQAAQPAPTATPPPTALQQQQQQAKVEANPASTMQPLYVATTLHDTAAYYQARQQQQQPAQAMLQNHYQMSNTAAMQQQQMPQQQQLMAQTLQAYQQQAQQNNAASTITTQTLPAAQPQQQQQQPLNNTTFAAGINHPGYNFNPQTGIYEYGSGYQQGSNVTQNFYGQYTSTAPNVGTTDSDSARKMNVATGFDSPVVSHTKPISSSGVDTNLTPTITPASSNKSSEVPYNYYTPPYGYQSNGLGVNPAAMPANSEYNASSLQQQTAAVQLQQQQQQQQQQTFGGTSTAYFPQQIQQAQVVQQPAKQHSIYMQSGGVSIAPTNTTKSAAEYASSIEQQKSLAQATSQAAKTMNEKKTSSNVDLLSDINFGGADVNAVPPPLLPTPVLKPLVVPISKTSDIATTNTTEATSAAKTILMAEIPTTSTAMNMEQHLDNFDNLSICSDLSSLDTNFDSETVTSPLAKTAATAAIPAPTNTTTSIINNSQRQNTNMGNMLSTFIMRPCDPFTDQKVLRYFHKEVERYEKTMDTLNMKMLNGNTQLSAKWKELQDLLENDNKKRTTVVAKLFPEKNRSVDCLPYDHARVKLERNTDDYINAAYIKDIGLGCPNIIITQTPLQNTITDFWSMIWFQRARTIVCMHTTNEMLDPYWPQELNSESNYDDYCIKCVQINSLSHTVEYQLKLSMHGADPVIDLSVLQIKAWTKRLPSQILGIASNALQLHQQYCCNFQTPQAPMVFNCLMGSERSEFLAIAICSILATQSKRPVLINVVDVWYRICAARQNSLRNLAMLEEFMHIVLSHAHDVLNKRGIMTSYQMKIAPQVASKEKEEIKDPLNELDPLWKLK